MILIFRMWKSLNKENVARTVKISPVVLNYLNEHAWTRMEGINAYAVSYAYHSSWNNDHRGSIAYIITVYNMFNMLTVSLPYFNKLISCNWKYSIHMHVGERWRLMYVKYVCVLIGREGGKFHFIANVLNEWSLRRHTLIPTDFNNTSIYEFINYFK